MTRKIAIQMDITNTLSYTRTVEVADDASDKQINTAINRLEECLNWGDLDDMFNMEGPPEFDSEWEEYEGEEEVDYVLGGEGFETAG